MAAIDVGEDDFQGEVLDRSQSTPVVVDFWAPWCGRCRAFAPVLEAAVAARGGAVVLVKLDTEACPSLAGYLEVHGIPAVKAFRRRDVVAQFVGARSPAWVGRFLDGLAPQEIDDLLAAGDEASVRRAVELDPRRADAAVALAEILHRRGEDGAALAALKPAAGFRAAALAARIRLAGRPELEPAFAALDAGEIAPALDLLLAPPGGADAADRRRLAASLLDGLGFGHPLERAYRPRLRRGSGG